MKKKKQMNKKRVTWYMLGSILYAMVVYILSIAFALQRNYVHTDSRPYQTELDYMIQEISHGSIIAYGMLFLQLSAVVFVVVAVWNLMKLFMKKRQV